MSGGDSLALNMVYCDYVGKDAFSLIKAEDFNCICGHSVNNTGDIDGVKELREIKNNFYTGYAKVIFGEGTGANRLKFRTSTKNENDKIELHLDSIPGTLIGIVDLSNTKGSTNYETATSKSEITTGNLTVYLIFKGSEDFYLNWFQFYYEIEAEEEEEEGIIICEEKCSSCNLTSNSLDICIECNNNKGYFKGLYEVKLSSKGLYLYCFNEETNLKIFISTQRQTLLNHIIQDSLPV